MDEHPGPNRLDRFWVATALAAAIVALIFGTLITSLVAQARNVAQEVRDGQECIIGTLLFTPDVRRNEPGIVFDELCGFAPGTIDRIRAEHGIDVPTGDTP